MSMKTLQGLGWEWRQNGVVICVQLQGGEVQQVFVPLNRVWHEFSKELSAVGCPLPASVGAVPTVAGLFSGIAHLAKGVAHAVTHNAITKAASSVVNTAGKYAIHAVSKIPVVGPLAKSVASLVTLPLNVAEQLAAGGRIDKVAMGSLKSALSSVKQIAPYATTVLSLVPGVGTGLSGAIGAGLALASGQNISDALVTGVRGALPGGALSAAAFDVAHAAMQGKPIDQIALNALPIAPQAKQALAQGVSVAKDLAAGKKVSQAVVDAATHALPPELQKAVQIGAALGHARNLQGAVGTLKHAANLSALAQAGVAAAKQIQAAKPGAPVPPHLLAAVKSGLAAKAHVTAAISHAQAGHPASAKLVAALQLHQAHAATAPRPGGRSVRPRYHTASGGAQPTVGALWSPMVKQLVHARAQHVPHPQFAPVASAFAALARQHARALPPAHMIRPSFMLPPRSLFAAARA
jgi:hypothetical protein